MARIVNRNNGSFSKLEVDILAVDGVTSPAALEVVWGG